MQLYFSALTHYRTSKNEKREELNSFFLTNLLSSLYLILIVTISGFSDVVQEGFKVVNFYESAVIQIIGLSALIVYFITLIFNMIVVSFNLSYFFIYKNDYSIVNLFYYTYVFTPNSDEVRNIEKGDNIIFFYSERLFYIKFPSINEGRVKKVYHTVIKTYAHEEIPKRNILGLGPDYTYLDKESKDLNDRKYVQLLETLSFLNRPK